MAIDLNDKTANGNNLTNVNTVTEVTTSLPFPQSTIAADFEAGSSQYFTADDSASLSITGNLSIESWVKFESTPASGNLMTFVSKFNQNAKRSYLFALHNNGGTLQMRFVQSQDGTNENAGAVNWTPSTGTWYHIAVTYEASSADVKFYVDGAQQGTTQNVTQTAIFNSAALAGIGAFFDAAEAAGNFFDGVMDDVRVWNTVRTVTQIADNKSIELAGNESGLVAYWPFEAGLGGVSITDDYAYLL